MAVVNVSLSEIGEDLTKGANYCRRLERGEIVCFDRSPIDIPQTDLDWLLETKADNSGIHKNISYRPGQDIIRGFSASDGERILKIMRAYSKNAIEFLEGFLSPYAGKFQTDYASFRPIEEAGRKLPLHKRNELLHVDAFPSRPTFGGRILRFFVNINPYVGRVWEIGEPFDSLAAKHARAAGLDRIKRRDDSAAGRLIQTSRRAASKVGLPTPERSAYDQFMLRFHDHMKEDTTYQANSPRERIEFPPFASWIVYTDCVPHSVLSGQFAMEQTLIIPFDALVEPEASPLRILEGIAGGPLVTR
jgi:hypothetical protein